jgi:hypothetical protein
MYLAHELNATALGVRLHGIAGFSCRLIVHMYYHASIV